MTTTYERQTVPSPATDDTILAAHINSEIDYLLTSLNDFDASNCKKTGTSIPLANITNLTSSQMAAAFFLDEDDMASNSAIAVSSQQAIKAYVDAQIFFSEKTANDSDSNAMLKTHAYLAQTDGFVSATQTAGGAGDGIVGYVDGTDNPAGAGEAMDGSAAHSGGQIVGVSFAVKSGEYFEIIADDVPNIYWRSMGTLTNPIDQD